MRPAVAWALLGVTLAAYVLLLALRIPTDGLALVMLVCVIVGAPLWLRRAERAAGR